MCPAKRKVGRPTYFTPEQELQVIELSRQNPGMSLRQLAQHWVETHCPGRKPPAASTVYRVMKVYGHQHLTREVLESQAFGVEHSGQETRYQAHHRIEPDTNYPSDVTDSQWKQVAALLVRPGQRGPTPTNPRNTLNAIFYIARTGCQWRYLPRDFGKWNSIAKTFYRWRDSGLLQKVHDQLHQQARLKAGRDKQPSMVILDSQSVKTTEKGGLEDSMQVRKPKVENVIS